jgi:regulatory protein
VLPQKRLTPQQALPKLAHYCAYQERSHAEVKQKLAGLGVFGTDAEHIISHLIAENYLNEERYAQQFALGKHRMKGWGKLKIKHALQQQQVSSFNIILALKSIDTAAYEAKALQLAIQKSQHLPQGNQYTQQAKLIAYLQQKGYESQVIQNALRQMKNAEE